MDFKVSYYEVANFSDFLFGKSEELNQHFIEMLQIIEQMQNYWDGSDAKAFGLNSSSYIRNILYSNVRELKLLALFIKKISNEYELTDKEWLVSIKKEGLSYEKN